MSAGRTCEMTEYFLWSDLPSMRNEAGAKGEALQSAPAFAAVGPSRSPVRLGASAGGEPFSKEPAHGGERMNQFMVSIGDNPDVCAK